MKKNWNSPEVEALSVSATQYGGTVVREFDGIYVNAEGNWEATFEPDPNVTSGSEK